MRLTYKLLLASAAAVVGLSSARAEAQQFGSYAPHMFANQYTQGYANQATAQMYVAPLPVPTWVGHTYYTYPPLNPHEMMYRHHRRYHSYYDNGMGLNRTGVHYSAPPVRTGLKRALKSLSLPRP